MQQDPSNENFNISFQCGNVFNNVSIPCSLTNASCKTQVPVNINPLLVLTCKYCSVVVVNKVKGTTASRMYETSYLSSVCPDTLPQRYKNRIEGFDAVGLSRLRPGRPRPERLWYVPSAAHRPIL